MKAGIRRRAVWLGSGRRACARGAGLALLVVLGVSLAGCGEEVSREFRSAASSSLEQGLNSIFDGLVAGLFAVVEPNETSGTGGG